MKLTLPAALDAALAGLAAKERTSKKALVIEAVQALVEHRQQHEAMSSVLKSVRAEDAYLMERLGDA